MKPLSYLINLLDNDSSDRVSITSIHCFIEYIASGIILVVSLQTYLVASSFAHSFPSHLKLDRVSILFPQHLAIYSHQWWYTTSPNSNLICCLLSLLVFYKLIDGLLSFILHSIVSLFLLPTYIIFVSQTLLVFPIP